MLGGQRKEVTVLFCDLRGFTTAAEDLEATFMVGLLNEYFGEMVQAIFAHRGEVNKFIGDALLAIWGGVQKSQPVEDARHAVSAALDMKDRRLALNARRAQEGRPAWEAGIGITQGMVVFGNVGAQERMEPAVIGDTVNLASRIEGLTRTYGCDILIDERVAAQARDVCELLLVDIVRVRGRRAHEALFFPYRIGDTAWSEGFTRARLSYLDRRFAEARELFAELKEDGPAPGLAARYQHRCEVFLKAPPPGDWDGIWDFAEK
jgi:adenylate cyclase